MTKLSSSLPKEYEDDGLASINSDLVQRPTEPQMVVAMIDCKAVTRDIDSGLDIATARILHIEPLTDPAAAERARDMLLAAQERRTGRQALPIEQVNVETGEIDLKHASGVISFGKGRK